MVPQLAKVEEIVDIYPVDFFIQPNLVLEVNGPTHFAFADDSKEMTFSTKIKKMHLELQGYKVKYLNYFDWESNKGVNRRLELVRNLLYSNV